MSDLDSEIRDNKKKCSNKSSNENSSFWADVLDKIGVCKSKAGLLNRALFKGVTCIIIYNFNRLGI